MTPIVARTDWTRTVRVLGAGQGLDTVEAAGEGDA
jgi:hypothetical protein